MQFYTVHHINQYAFVLTLVNIEDAVGEVIDSTTRDEMIVRCIRMWRLDDGDSGHAYVRRDAVVQALAQLQASAVLDGKTSFSIDDDLLKVVSHSPITTFLPGVTRSGNVVRIVQRRPVDLTKPKVNDFHKLVERAKRTISHKYNFEKGSAFEVKIMYAAHNKKGAVDVIKKLVSLDEIVAFCNNGPEWRAVDEADQVKMRKIWDNPNIIASKKKTVDQTA